MVGWVKETVAAGEEDKLVEALEELESQVTDIDNAGDLDSVGGVNVVLELLDHPLPKVSPPLSFPPFPTSSPLYPTQNNRMQSDPMNLRASSRFPRFLTRMLS